MFFSKKKPGEFLICQRQMLFCFSLSDQSINYSHSSAVEKWTVHHEFANIASAITFFFDSKWGIINLDLFFVCCFLFEKNDSLDNTCCSSPESYSIVKTNFFFGFNEKHYSLFLKNNNIIEKTPCENFRPMFSDTCWVMHQRKTAYYHHKNSRKFFLNSSKYLPFQQLIWDIWMWWNSVFFVSESVFISIQKIICNPKDIRKIICLLSAPWKSFEHLCQNFSA